MLLHTIMMAHTNYQKQIKLFALIFCPDYETNWKNPQQKSQQVPLYGQGTLIQRIYYNVTKQIL